jgi:pyruvate/2-oxoacid:ferredoxin oxidoreductase alpha subunit
MPSELIKGNQAVIKGAILAGCKSFYGYPITPASEIAEAAAVFFPRSGGTFLQAESEVAAINMVYGAASTGERTMTASSSPGISLMQEAISYLAGAELPCVIADIMRGGPGLGNIAPEQGDYFQIVKGGGHGNYRNLVLAPASVQEMCNLTMKAFELADRYRNPAFVLADGYIGQMMEPVHYPKPSLPKDKKPWAVQGTPGSRQNLVTSIYLDPERLEKHNQKLQAKYQEAEVEAMFEEYRADDAEILLVGYGIISRILRTVVDQAREEGIRAGMFRPITLWPFPSVPLAERSTQAMVHVVEMSAGQLVEDVRLAVAGRSPVEFLGRSGGGVPSVEEILRHVKNS